MIRNKVVSLRDVVEWTNVDPLPEGTTVTVAAGGFVLQVPGDGQPWDSIIMESPDGTAWVMTVDNSGAWTSTSLTLITDEDGDVLGTETGDLLTVE